MYLYTTVDQQVARTRKAASGRCSKTAIRAHARGVAAERDPLYREIADLVVETDGRKVKSVADEIIEQSLAACT